MPRKFQEVQQEKPKLDDEQYKLQVLAFENELQGRSFDRYCIEEGFRVHREGYHDYFIVAGKIEAYNVAKQLYKDLENLRERRRYMEKQEHLKLLTLYHNSECPDLPDCKYCNPPSLRDMLTNNAKTTFPSNSRSDKNRNDGEGA